MAWTVKVLDKLISNGQITVTVEYSDGADTFSETHSIKTTGNLIFERQISARIKQLEALGTYAATIPIGDIDLVALENKLADSADEIARKQYHKWVTQLTGAMEAVRLGVLTGSESQITTLRDNLKNNFIPEYINEYI